MKPSLRMLWMICLLLSTACKDETASVIDTDDDPYVPPNIAGTWSGTYSDNVSHGTFAINLNLNGSALSGTYTATSSTGAGGGGTVSGTLSGDSVQLQTIATAGGCTIVNSVSGVCTGFGVGDTLAATYFGSNSCGGSWSNGVLSLRKQ